ncbi:Alpha/Beta hydrolase protein [Dichomitus squalens]|uniref:Alpha/Beta hydrolase protein n=1 Tax=Dichomitus squalens TaxID=114155 RepID=A0A4Q9Q4Q3_9APHY|nr:Alpha/Beta hydrolase protein [Dichomitus squalens]
MAAPTKVKAVTIDGGVDVFYREAVPASASATDPSALPVVLLLHGFPASSFQCRNLIPVLAARYRVLAPDLPGYGFTAVPAARAYEYTFAALTDTVATFLDALAMEVFGVRVRLRGVDCVQRPQAIKAIVSQNGNAYEDGFGEDFWAPVKKAWTDPSENLAALEKVTSLEVTKWQVSIPRSSLSPKQTLHLEYYRMTRAGSAENQLKLLVEIGEFEKHK